MNRKIKDEQENKRVKFLDINRSLTMLEFASYIHRETHKK